MSLAKELVVVVAVSTRSVKRKMAHLVALHVSMTASCILRRSSRRSQALLKPTSAIKESRSGKQTALLLGRSLERVSLLNLTFKLLIRTSKGHWTMV